MEQVKDVSAKTVESLAKQSLNLQRMLRHLQANDMEATVFKTIKLSVLLESIKSFD